MEAENCDLGIWESGLGNCGLSLIWELRTEIWEFGVRDWETAESCELRITETTIRCKLGPPRILLAESLFATLVCSKLCIASQIIVSLTFCYFKLESKAKKQILKVSGQCV